MNTNQLIEYIEKLTLLGGVSSSEKEIADFLLGELSKICDIAEKDISGNVCGYINLDKPKTVLLEAHMDRIGLVVSEISDEGYVYFSEAGGIDERILPYSEVEFSGTDTSGVILSQSTDSDEKDMYIFTGLDKSTVEKKVKIGSKIIVKSKFRKLYGNEICGGALDNRAGIASIINALSNIDRDRLEYNVKVLFTTGEELGLHGAFKADEKSDADIAVVVDVTHGMTYDTKSEIGVFPLGCGAVICRGPNLHYRYSKQLIELAIKENIPYAIETASNSSGTTAWALQVVNGGIPSTLISIPLKYMHTSAEVANIKDIENVSRLIGCLVNGGIKID